MTAKNTPAKPQFALPALRSDLLIPALAILTALILGSIVIVFTNFPVLDILGGKASGDLLGAMWTAIATAYGSMFEGSIGNFGAIVSAFSRTAAAPARSSLPMSAAASAR